MAAPFETGTMLAKGGWSAVIAAAMAFGSSLLTEYLKNPEGFTWTPDHEQGMIVVLIAMGYSIYTMVKNWVKNQWRPRKSELFKLPLVLLCAALCGLAGCATWTPAVAGKTDYSMVFGDRVDPIKDAATGEVTNPGQDTKFEVKVKAPSGVKLDDLVSMGYKVAADGTVDIQVSKTAQTDTSGQAALIGQLAQIQAEAFNKAFELGINAAASLAAPWAGAQGEIALWKAQNPQPSGLEQSLGAIKDPDIRAWIEQLISKTRLQNTAVDAKP